jgi:hypothetical protein
MLMLECPYCFRVFRSTPEKVGARCPKCRMPMYERPAKRRTPEKNLGPCAQHPESTAVAGCERCGKLVCVGCRTRWHDEPTCPECIERSLLSDEPTTQENQKQQRQAWMGVVLAATGWFILVLTLWPLSAIHEGTQAKPIPYLTVAIFTLSFGPPLLALGQTAAALRLRGTHQKLAAWGLGLSGTQIGLAVGVLLLNVWHN